MLTTLSERINMSLLDIRKVGRINCGNLGRLPCKFANSITLSLSLKPSNNEAPTFGDCYTCSFYN